MNSRTPIILVFSILLSIIGLGIGISFYINKKGREGEIKNSSPYRGSYSAALPPIHVYCDKETVLSKYCYLNGKEWGGVEGASAKMNMMTKKKFFIFQGYQAPKKDEKPYVLIKGPEEKHLSQEGICHDKVSLLNTLEQIERIPTFGPLQYFILRVCFNKYEKAKNQRISLPVQTQVKIIKMINFGVNGAIGHGLGHIILGLINPDNPTYYHPKYGCSMMCEEPHVFELHPHTINLIKKRFPFLYQK